MDSEQSSWLQNTLLRMLRSWWRYNSSGLRVAANPPVASLTASANEPIKNIGWTGPYLQGITKFKNVMYFFTNKLQCLTDTPVGKLVSEWVQGLQWIVTAWWDQGGQCWAGLRRIICRWIIHFNFVVIIFWLSTGVLLITAARSRGRWQSSSIYSDITGGL